MKTISILLIQIFFAAAFANAQESKNTRYFDTNNKEVTVKKFNEIRSTNRYLDIIGDSTNHRKLIIREEKGIIDRNKLVAELQKASKTEIDTNSIIFIVYYPGEDPCNSTGNGERAVINKKETEKTINDLAKITTLYIYKNISGIERHKGLNWIKDPNGLIENLFFKHHYPCGSFVAISKEGSYISYFGEYAPSFVLKAITLLKDN